MRRTDRETTREEAWRIFDQSAYSVLSMSYRNRPYATALSVARIDETLYFHCARDGEKIRAMRENPNVCLHSVARMENCAEGFTVYYASCTIRGIAQEWLMKRNGIARCLPSAGPLYHRAWTWQSRKSAI